MHILRLIFRRYKGRPSVVKVTSVSEMKFMVIRWTGHGSVARVQCENHPLSFIYGEKELHLQELMNSMYDPPHIIVSSEPNMG